MKPMTGMAQLLVFVILMVQSASLFACKCSNLPLKDRFDHAAAVFIGSTKASTESEPETDHTVVFHVSRWLKGNAPEGSEIRINPLLNSDCAAPLVPDAEVIVFADYRAPPDLSVSVCNIAAVAPLKIGGETMQPSPDVMDFVRSISGSQSD